MDKLFNENFVLLDGALGTMLQSAGMPAGLLPEVYALEHPEIIQNIHRAYVDAGSRIVYTNTFSSNARKLSGSGHSVEEIVTAAVKTAKAAADGKALVALDIGPIGEMMEPAGTLTFDDAYDLFREILTAGEKAGADLAAFETFSDLAELRVGVLAAKENTSLPIFATMTFEEGGRTFTGTLAESFAVIIGGLGVDALGVNCSLGPDKLMPIIRRIAAVTSLPLIVKANAGLPDAHDGHYDIGAQQFADQMEECAEIGVKYIGGCCGTTPEYIFTLKNRFSDKTRAEHSTEKSTIVCSATRLVTIDSPRIIGERINPTGKKRFQQALRENDLDYVLAQGIAQMDAGADILDVNVGVPGLDEAALMRKCVSGLSSTTDLPLQIDSNDPTVLEAGLRTFCGKAIINSVNGEETKLKTVLPLAKKYGAAVVGLTIDEKGIPETAEERFEIAKRILDDAKEYGISGSDVFIDCLCMTVSANQNSAAETLKAVRMVKEKLGTHCLLGVSNISFGLPNRELVNRSFLTLALENGLDLPIINPNVSAMAETVAAFRLLRGYDSGCNEFISRYAAAEAPKTVTAETAPDIFSAVSRGMAKEAADVTEKLLSEKQELEIVNEMLIPALDIVGERFEKGQIFLPQLIRSADAAGAAFEVVRKHMLAKGGQTVSKGKIVIATVKGDIHDIGKNIVKTVLSNYGYRVIDLGRDVSPETIVEAAVSENAKLIGLSALMTTTLPAMSETIATLHRSGHDCKVMVGGAVMTPEYAAEIGADYYSKDAKEAVDIAKKVLG